MDKASKLYKYPIGAYFFKYNEDNELVLIRLYKIKSDNVYIFKDTDKNKVVLTKKQLQDYSMLEPDGLIIHVLASDPNNGIDTMCLLYRLSDINNNITDAYAICRQNVIDPFEMLLNNDSNKIYVGLSMSKGTAPEGFDYKSLSMVTGVKDQKINFIYKDDSFENIMSFVNEKLYDKALSIIKSHMTEEDNIKYVGFNDTYRGLLTENRFMDDFRRAFQILKINIDIDKSINRWTEDGIYKISDDEIKTIESITKYYVLAPILIRYDKTIDLSEIKRSYIFFEDLNNELYIISYDKGEYVNREYDSLSDQRDKELLQQIINDK